MFPSTAWRERMPLTGTALSFISLGCGWISFLTTLMFPSTAWRERMPLTGTASTSSSKEGWDSIDIPFLGLVVILLGGSGGGISSSPFATMGTSSWLESVLLLFFFFLSFLKLLSGVARIWSARLNWSSSSSSSAGGGGGGASASSPTSWVLVVICSSRSSIGVPASFAGSWHSRSSTRGVESTSSSPSAATSNDL